MIRKLQTLDLEFSEWCHELLTDGMDPINFLRILSQYRFIWEACRRRCADFCVQHGSVDIARKIMTNEDGAMIEDWRNDRMSDRKSPRYDFYLGGPMRGYPDLNYPLFNKVCELMTNKGLLVYNPAAYDGGLSLGDTGNAFAFCMLRDLNAVINLCDGIALLPEWRDSLGANVESFVAFACGKRIVEINLNYQEDDFVLTEIDLSEYKLPYDENESRSFDPHKCPLDKFEPND